MLTVIEEHYIIFMSVNLYDHPEKLAYPEIRPADSLPRQCVSHQPAKYMWSFSIALWINQIRMTSGDQFTSMIEIKKRAQRSFTNTEVCSDEDRSGDRFHYYNCK